MHPNTSGLVSFADMDSAERAAIASKGGKARQEQWRAEKIARKVLEQKVTDVAEYDYGAIPVKEATVLELIMAVHANKALKGDKESAKLVLDTAKTENNKTTVLGGFQFITEPGDDAL